MFLSAFTLVDDTVLSFVSGTKETLFVEVGKDVVRRRWKTKFNRSDSDLKLLSYERVLNFESRRL